ncbi:conserved hypothetical protein [Aeropyrum pernix]|uniref:DUF35 domain-containing protein n=1 Tax=Aeropyrum pernix TaxID=56636 RepID=A0A401H994_AERPX|nr:Zn-ribbon domain-containing OB-fold protein [Aeropyrum pernix]GBF09011.1 conserved hypothetical protein [Aeropyrum pernix]
MPDGGKKLPGTYLSEKDLRALPGLVEHTPDAKYMFSAGQAQSRFLQGLREGRILGVKCPRCGRVYVPPRSYCEYCFAPTGEWVEVSGEGEVHTAVVSYISTFRERMEKPEIIAVVRLYAPGYTGKRDEYEFPGMFHKLCGVSEEDVKTGRVIGMRVKPKWRPPEERIGSVTDIECFEPVKS